MEYSDFVPFDIAEALKSAGFDVPCAFYFAKADSDEDMMLIVSDGETLDHNNVAMIIRSWFRSVLPPHTTPRLNGFAGSIQFIASLLLTMMLKTLIKSGKEQSSG